MSTKSSSIENNKLIKGGLFSLGVLIGLFLVSLVVGWFIMISIGILNSAFGWPVATIGLWWDGFGLGFILAIIICFRNSFSKKSQV